MDRTLLESLLILEIFNNQKNIYSKFYNLWNIVLDTETSIASDPLYLFCLSDIHSLTILALLLLLWSRAYINYVECGINHHHSSAVPAAAPAGGEWIVCAWRWVGGDYLTTYTCIHIAWGVSLLFPAGAFSSRAKVCPPPTTSVFPFIPTWTSSTTTWRNQIIILC